MENTHYALCPYCKSAQITSGREARKTGFVVGRTIMTCEKCGRDFLCDVTIYKYNYVTQKLDEACTYAPLSDKEREEVVKERCVQLTEEFASRLFKLSDELQIDINSLYQAFGASMENLTAKLNKEDIS